MPLAHTLKAPSPQPGRKPGRTPDTFHSARLLAALALWVGLVARWGWADESVCPPSPQRDLFPMSMLETWQENGLATLDLEPFDPDGSQGGRRFSPPSCSNPVLFVAADYLALDRAGTRYAEYARLGANSTTAALSRDSISEVDMASGARLTVGALMPEVGMISATYYGFYHWNDSATASSLNNDLFSPFSGFGVAPVAGVDNNSQAAIAYSCDLQNAEINLYGLAPTPCGPLEASCSCGVRYLQLEEQFRYRTQSPLPEVVTDDVSTRNQLLGGQIGGMLDYWLCPVWWIECEAKTGLYHNFARLRNVFTRENLPLTNDQTVTNGRTSFIGELMLASHFRLTDHLVIRGGYQMIWVCGVAVAEENFSVDLSRQSIGTPLMNRNGSLVFHGPHAGLTWEW